jgi:hypothetical protein
MDLQFFVAVGIMSLSVMAAFLGAIRRSRGWQGWIAANILVVFISAMAS